MMEGYFADERNIGLVVQLLDMRHKPTEDDYLMMRYLRDCGFNFIVAATKSDKLNKTEFETRKRELKEELAEFGEELTVIPFSSEKGTGVPELKEVIEKYAR